MSRMMMVLCCLLFLLLSCAGNGTARDTHSAEPWTAADQATEDALAAGDYGSAIDVVLKQAEAGDPEMQFWVGYLYLEWLGDLDAKEPPAHQASKGLEWIRKAAAKGIPQAVETLRSGYQWGKYSLAKDHNLEVCWRKVERGEEQPASCLAAEAQ
ncbi:MAG: hypothetical protein AB7V26_07955 [Lysobacterales bacterium]